MVDLLLKNNLFMKNNLFDKKKGIFQIQLIVPLFSCVLCLGLSALVLVSSKAPIGDWAHLIFPRETKNSQEIYMEQNLSTNSLALLGPLKVSSSNPRYLSDVSGKAVILAGSNYWNAMQDGGRTNPPPAYDFNAFVNFLVGHGMNYTKAHVWEQSWHQSYNQDWYIAPTIYARTGPGNALDGGLKFNLNELNPAYFDRLRSRVIQYGQNNIYVTINIFDRFSVQDGNTMTDQWLGHPFNANNNINGINGDPTGQGNGLDAETLIIPSITAYQEAYVQQLIDTLNDLDNVIWEVAMEPWGGYSRNGYTPEDWVDHFIDFIHTYKSTKAKQHPVLQGVFYPDGSGDNTYLFSSNADVISPNGSGGFDHDAPVLDGTKVVLVDTDHILWIETDGADWVWRAFTRGAGGFAMMDGGYSNYDDQGGGAGYNESENFRYNLGWMLDYADRMNLVDMTPRGDLCSTGYCLANPSASGAEYLVYLPLGSTATSILEDLGMSKADHKRLSSIYLLPDSSVTVDLSGTQGSLSIEWFNPGTGQITQDGTVVGGSSHNFTAPFMGSAVLYLYQSGVGEQLSISNLSVHPLDTKATITWDTNRLATSQVFYGKTPALGMSTQETNSYVTSHSVLISGLTPNTTYYYRVASTDVGSQNVTSDVLSFKTLATVDIRHLYLPFGFRDRR